MAQLGYTCEAELKLIRRKHMVRFRVGMRAEDLVSVLKSVPPNATVDEVIDDGDADSDSCSIEFHEEKVEHE